MITKVVLDTKLIMICHVEVTPYQLHNERSRFQTHASRENVQNTKYYIGYPNQCT